MQPHTVSFIKNKSLYRKTCYSRNIYHVYIHTQTQVRFKDRKVTQIYVYKAYETVENKIYLIKNKNQ